MAKVIAKMISFFQLSISSLNINTATYIIMQIIAYSTISTINASLCRFYVMLYPLMSF